MATKKAFPSPHDGRVEGMDLRDFFAAQALIAVASRWQGTIGDLDEDAVNRSAVLAYDLADAMMEIRR